MLVRMPRSSDGETHDNELRIDCLGRQLDDFWPGQQRQGDAAVVGRLCSRLPRCHVCLARECRIMRREHRGDKVLGAYRRQPLIVAPNFAEGDHVKVLLMHTFAYHAL